MRAVLAVVAAVVLLVACGAKDKNLASDADGGPTAEAGPNGPPVDGGVTGDGSPPVWIEAGNNNGSTGCGAFSCPSGCCVGGTCLPGNTPAQCGKGGLVCVDCPAMGLGCVNQGCGVATCTGCNGCCHLGTCNPNGKTQDNQCGTGGAVCKDCTANSQTCNGNGICI